MERAEVLQVMTDKAVEILDVEAADVRDEASLLEDLHADSLMLVEYTMDLEDAFGIELVEDDLAGADTIGAFADVIHAKVMAKS